MTDFSQPPNGHSGRKGGIETYLAYLKDKGLSKNSIKEAKSHILHFQEFGNDLVGYMVYLRLKGYTRDTIISKNAAVKAYLRWIG